MRSTLALRCDRLDAVFLEDLLARSLGDLLEHGRVETVRQWCESARAAGLLSPLIELLEAETLFREGWHERAFIVAARASTELQDSPLLAEALCLAGQSAHLADLPEEARQCFADARRHARTATDLQRALWGQFITTVELGADGAADILQEFEQAGTRSIDHLVRTQNGWLYLQMKERFVAHCGRRRTTDLPASSTGARSSYTCFVLEHLCRNSSADESLQSLGASHLDGLRGY